MKRILIIGPFPDPISGVSLANKVVKNVLDASNEYKTTIVNTSYPYFDEHVGKFSIKKFLFFLKMNSSFFKIFNADIVYITPGQTFFGIVKYSVFILLSKLLGKELVIHVHGNYLGYCYSQLKGIKRKMFYALVSQFSKGIVLSKLLRNNLTPFLDDDKIYELPNFAEDYLLKDENNKLLTNNDKLQIVFLSNLMLEKGILVLLDALKYLEDQNICYEARIAGNIDVTIEKEILDNIKNLKNTSYIGVVKGNEKKDLLSWSNTFILPTYYKMEGQPISILEALATENLIITTAHAGILDIINNNEHGFLVEKRNVESLQLVLTELSNNLTLVHSIRRKNKEYFKNNFTINQFKSRIIKILNA